MPGGDRTGPRGAGPMTGRRAGLCAGYDVPGYLNTDFGFGFGYGRGRGFGRGYGMGGGRGRRNRFYSTGSPYYGARGRDYDYGGRPEFADPLPRSSSSGTAGGDELAYLMEQARYLREIMDDIQSRMKVIEDEMGSNPKSREKE